MARSGQSSARGPEDFTAVAELAEHFTALVDALTSGSSRDLTPQAIVELAGRTVPGTQHVGLIADADGRLQTLAATSDVPEQLDRLRRDTGEGPAMDALTSNLLVVSGDLAVDPRWPTFGPRASQETGVRSLASYRLYFGRDHRGALTFCSDWPHAFDDLAVATGAIFAAYCSLSLMAHLLSASTVDAGHAAQVSREVGVAVGILMSTGDLEHGHAWQRLHEASQRLRRSLPDVAREVIETRQLPDA